MRYPKGMWVGAEGRNNKCGNREPTSGPNSHRRVCDSRDATHSWQSRLQMEPVEADSSCSLLRILLGTVG